MAEVVENNKNRWDAGAGTTALGIIGTTLGGLATAMAGGNALTGSHVGNAPFETHGVCQHDIQTLKELEAANAQIARLESEKYTDKTGLEIYKYFDGQLKELRATINQRFAAQDVINANMQSSLGVLKSQVDASAALLASITKTAIPKSVICNFDPCCNGCCQTNVM